jgi:hypothetical protein
VRNRSSSTGSSLHCFVNSSHTQAYCHHYSVLNRTVSHKRRHTTNQLLLVIVLVCAVCHNHLAVYRPRAASEEVTTKAEWMALALARHSDVLELVERSSPLSGHKTFGRSYSAARTASRHVINHNNGTVLCYRSLARSLSHPPTQSLTLSLSHSHLPTHSLSALTPIYQHYHRTNSLRQRYK